MLPTKFRFIWQNGFREKNFNQRLPGACNRSPGSKLLSITMQLHCGGHLGGRARLPDTILEEDHPMTIPLKFGSNWATGSRQDVFYVNFPYGPMLNQVQLCSHHDQRVGPPDTILEVDHPMTILSKFGSNWATGSRQEDFYVNFP